MFGQRSIALAVCCTVGLAIFAASLTHAVAADQPPTIQPAVEAEPAEAFVMPVAEDVPVDEAVVEITLHASVLLIGLLLRGSGCIARGAC